MEEEFEEWLYRNERLELFFCPLTDQYSKMGETEGQFRVRLAHAAREARDEAIDKIRDKIESKLKTKEGQLDRALAAVERERTQANNAKLRAGGSILNSVIGILFSRKKISSTNVRRGSSTVTQAGNAMQQARDVEVAEAKVEDIRAEIAELEEDLREEIQELEQKFDPAALQLEKDVVKPYKKDIQIDSVGLIWIGV